MDAHRCRQESALQEYCLRREVELELLRALAAYRPRHCRTVVRTACRLLRITLLECALLRWLLAARPALPTPSPSLPPFPHTHQRSLFLLLLLHAYHVKTFLNALPDPSLDAALLQALPDFPALYAAWQPARELSSLGLSGLSALFAGQEQQERGERDYNQMVGRILDLSKSYNTAHQQPHPRTARRRKHHQQHELEGREESHQPSVTPLYEPAGDPEQGEGEPVGLLRVSSLVRAREWSRVLEGDSRPLFASGHNSSPSLLGSAPLSRLRPSFFDDI